MAGLRRPGDREVAVERIVVGIDGSAASVEAFRWAVDQARRTGATVEAVHAWHQAAVAPTHIAGDVGYFEQKAREALKAAIAPVDAGDVAVECKVPAGNPSQALLHEAKGAALLVVGSRGRGGFSGLLLGSVSQQVAGHAPCPVLIVPPRAR